MTSRPFPTSLRATRNGRHGGHAMLGRHDLMLAILAAVGVIGCNAVFAEPPAQAAGPLVIAKQGYFFAVGRIDPSIEGSPMVGQMYVEFQIPQKLEDPCPLLMIPRGSRA